MSKEIDITCAGVDGNGKPVFKKENRTNVVIEIFPGNSVNIGCAFHKEGFCTASGVEGVHCKQIKTDNPHALNILPRLTRREKQIFKLIHTGAERSEIAFDLDTSDNTIRLQINSMYDELGIKRRNQAIALGLTSGDIKTSRINKEQVHEVYNGLDLLDKKIISEIIENNMPSITDITDVIGMAPAHIRSRVLKLYDKFQVRNFYQLFYLLWATDMTDSFPRISEEEWENAKKTHKRWRGRKK